MTGKLYIVEGPDCSGKTSLAKFIARAKGAIYWHSSGAKSLHLSMWDYHASIIDSIVVNLRNDRSVVLDRHWPSELCYGTVLRPHVMARYDFKKMLLKLVAHAPIYIFCGDEHVQERHSAEKNMDHPYDASTFAAICQEYRRLEEEFLGDKWHYSITEHGADMASFVKELP